MTIRGSSLPCKGLQGLYEWLTIAKKVCFVKPSYENKEYDTLGEVIFLIFI